MSFAKPITREVRRYMERENARMPRKLIFRPREEWPSPDKWPDGLVEVWQSRDFLVQLYEPKDGAQRMTVCRTTVAAGGERWQEGISWDDLQQLKRECGRGQAWAVEVYPDDDYIVNVANMRHLWLLPERPTFAWHNEVTPARYHHSEKS